MGETMQQMREQLNEYWESLEKDKKKKIIIGGTAILACIIILVVFLSRPKYEVLYENLTLKDTAEVTEKLDELNIKWKTGDEETTILVPKGMQNKIKIELASEGLPKEGYGFYDAFSESNWSMTDYEKRERLKYALQNELASSISEIDGVESAKVYIEEKEDSSFVLNEDEDETSASVFIEKSSSKSLAQNTVEAIRNLVAGSINMDPENVSVIDDTGALLTDDTDGSLDLSDRYNIKQNLEAKIDDSIRRFLENVFGHGNVDIRSSVKVNFDDEKTTTVEFEPPVEGSDEGLIRSMEEVEESMVGGSTGEVPGQDSNPIEDQVIPEDGVTRYDKASNIINYELNEINNEIRKAPGDIESVTVAVLINEDAIVDGQLTEERREDIEDLIYAATGLDTEQVHVSSNRFSTGDVEEETEARMSPLTWILLGVLILTGLIAFIIYRRRRDISAEEEIAVDFDETIEEPSIEEIDFDAESSEMKRQIEKSIRKNPDAIAKLLKTWLDE